MSLHLSKYHIVGNLMHRLKFNLIYQIGNDLERLFECARIVTCATTCDLQQCGILTSVASDEPVQPPVKLRNPE